MSEDSLGWFGKTIVIILWFLEGTLRFVILPPVSFGIAYHLITTNIFLITRSLFGVVASYIISAPFFIASFLLPLFVFAHACSRRTFVHRASQNEKSEQKELTDKYE